MIKDFRNVSICRTRLRMLNGGACTSNRSTIDLQLRRSLTIVVVPTCSPDPASLQAELLGLRETLRPARLRLQKSDASSPAAPFPLTAAAAVEAPPVASHFDVNELMLQLSVGVGAAASGTALERTAGVSLAVLGNALPLALHEAIVPSRWAALAGSVENSSNVSSQLHMSSRKSAAWLRSLAGGRLVAAPPPPPLPALLLLRRPSHGAMRLARSASLVRDEGALGTSAPRSRG